MNFRTVQPYANSNTAQHMVHAQSGYFTTCGQYGDFVGNLLVRYHKSLVQDICSSGAMKLLKYLGLQKALVQKTRL